MKGYNFTFNGPRCNEWLRKKINCLNVIFILVDYSIVIDKEDIESQSFDFCIMYIHLEYSEQIFLCPHVFIDEALRNYLLFMTLICSKHMISMIHVYSHDIRIYVFTKMLHNFENH